MIIVFGAIGVDIVTRVDRFPRPGESVVCDDFDVVPGTKGANQALAAARAGSAVVHIATKGDDASGIIASSLLQQAGVNLRYVQTVSTKTGTCLITVDGSGENMVVAASSANRHTHLDQLEACGFGPGDIVVLQCELLPEETFGAVRLARQRGARVVLNAAPPCPVPPAILEALDLLVVNETEAEVVGLALGLGAAAAHPEQVVRMLHENYGCAAVVTLGAGGAVLWDQGQRYAVRAPHVDVVDTTAAGDSFTGYLAAALDRGLSMETALNHGIIAGSLCCTRYGAQTGIPMAGEVMALVETFST